MPVSACGGAARGAGGAGAGPIAGGGWRGLEPPHAPTRTPAAAQSRRTARSRPIRYGGGVEQPLAALLAHARALVGVTLAELADGLGLPVPVGRVRTKGWPGRIIERELGAG